MSWAARQAAFHTGGRMVPFLNDLGIPASDLARGLEEAVQRLCDKAGQDPAPVLRNSITAIGDRRFRLRETDFTASFTTGLHTRVCPYCLAEDQVGSSRPELVIRHRVRWRLASYRTCDVHGTLMSDIRTNRWDDGLHELQGMTDAISAALLEMEDLPPRPPSNLQRYVEGRIAGESGPEWLDGQGVDQAVRAVEMLGGLIAFGPQQSASAMTPRMWDDAGRAAWNIVSEGSSAVSACLTDLLRESARREGKASPRKAFGMLFGWLSPSDLSTDPGPIRDVLREVIRQNVPLGPGQIVLGKSVKEPRLTSVAALAKMEKVHPKTLRKLLEDSGIINEAARNTPGGQIVVEYARARPLVETVKHSIPVSQVIHMLGVSRPMMAALLELGALCRVQQDGVLTAKVGKSIDGRSVQKLMDFVDETVSVIPHPAPVYVPFAKAAEKARVKLRIILEIYFDGHLRNVVRRSADERFDGLLVDVGEVKAVLQDPPDGLSPDAYFIM